VALSGWSEKLLEAGVPAHTVKHLCVMTELTKQGRYDRQQLRRLKSCLVLKWGTKLALRFLRKS
jgi:hypothetical protein